MQIQVRIILDKNTYFLKGQGQVGREIWSQRRPPQTYKNETTLFGKSSGYGSKNCHKDVGWF